MEVPMTNRRMYPGGRARAIIFALTTVTILLSSEALSQSEAVKISTVEQQQTAASVLRVVLPSPVLRSDFKMLVGDQSAGD
jgi:hypothetical protein